MEKNPALPSGKTSPARSAATKAQTSRSSYLNCAASQNQKPPLLLSLKAAGQTPDASLTWAAAALPGEPLTLNFTEYPNAAVGSSLSAILQDNVPDSYSLSPAACRGILRRAFVRGKPLPGAAAVRADYAGEPIGFAYKASGSAGSVAAAANTAPTLLSARHDAAICLQGSMIGRSDQNGPRGDGVNEGVSFTLNTTDRHAVVVENHPQDSRVSIRKDGTVQTLTGQMGTGGGNVPLVLLEE